MPKRTTAAGSGPSTTQAVRHQGKRTHVKCKLVNHSATYPVMRGASKRTTICMGSGFILSGRVYVLELTG
ncbi:hypothetical protein DPMN_024068 [Dreissena polymorpha]|uniref:Uncharacterized protein n=1 Tax=Dreissena polymorpha TaxID=45954 RepID=A0A9D4LLT8_DREPO|nr:hypothetical protein DPMN_024068 [Dreissena polymorpha]